MALQEGGRVVITHCGLAIPFPALDVRDHETEDCEACADVIAETQRLEEEALRVAATLPAEEPVESAPAVSIDLHAEETGEHVAITGDEDTSHKD